MSNIGKQINKAHKVVGLTFTILRDTGNISGEYSIVKNNAQVTKPFIREFFQDARFDYDTSVLAGDVIRTSDGRHLMVMNLTPSILKNTIIEKQAVLYKCNVSGQLSRLTGDQQWDENYNLGEAWSTVKDQAYGLMTEALYGNDLEANEQLGLLGLKANQLYMPSGYGAKIHDRYQSASGEYFRVDKISQRQYDHIYVADLSEDTR
jgi:hypothetical protein